MSLAYPLENLLEIRKKREDDASVELTRQRKLLIQAERSIEALVTELNDFIADRKQREKQTYAELMEQHAKIKDLDDYKLTVQILRDQEAQLEVNVEDARKRKAEIEAAVDKAAEVFGKLSKARQKIDEHRSQWVQEQERIQLLNEEKEMEDFRTRKLEVEANDLPY